MIKTLSIDRTLAIAQKEVFHILRDPFTLALSIGLPAILVTVFGLAIEFNAKDIAITVHDSDKTQASRQLVEALSSSQYFKIKYQESIPQSIRDLDQEKAKASLLIAPHFEKDLASKDMSSIQVLLDGSDNSAAGMVANHLIAARSLIEKKISTQTPPRFTLDTRFLFNPELNSRWFIVPGLATVVVAITSILLTSITVSREWENGSMELLLSTPVRPIEIILGKLAPYMLMGLLAVFFIYVVARLGFHVPFRGNHLLFILGTLIFLSAYLAQGILISILARTQSLSIQFGLVTGLLPSMLMSGFIFPIESMPTFFQYFTSILPAKWFMLITRALFLQGSSMLDLIRPFGALICLNIILISISTLKFKRDLSP